MVCIDDKTYMAGRGGEGREGRSGEEREGRGGEGRRGEESI